MDTSNLLCKGSHKTGDPFVKWQHTESCKAAMKSKRRRNGQAIQSNDWQPESLSFVERARNTGAI